MGFVKRMQMERHEQERERELAGLKAEADAEFPGEDWDPEDYESYKFIMEKDD